MVKYASLLHEAQMIANLGKATTIMGLVFAVLAIAAYVLAVKRPSDKKMLHVARCLYAATALSVLATFGILASRVYGMDFRFDYAFKETGRDLIQPDFLHHWLRIAATWAGQEGSFLLWATWVSLIGFLVFAKAGKYEARVMPFYISIIGFLCAILVKQTPFHLVPLPSAADFASNPGWAYPPVDGMGLNASLQNYWMTIHPPTIFFGFASLAVPFAYAVASLIWKDYDGWTPRVMPYALLTCATLGIGLFMGGYWAYETQGWHGFWAWDPVENASFFPWLAITALVHGLVVQKSRGGMGRTNTFLAIFAFWLFLLGTFLTRSGILKDFSVHSFVSIDLASKNLMVAMMVIYGLGGLGLWLWRFGTIPARKTLGDSLVSRDFAFFMAVVLMVVACVIVMLGTTAPISLTLLHRKAMAPEAVFYNKPLLPLTIITAFFMGIVPWLAWRKTDAEKFLGKLVVPWFLMLGFGFFMIFWTLSAEREWMAVANMQDPAIAATWAAWGKNVVVQRMAVVTLCSLGFLAALSNSMLVYKVFRSKPLAAGGWLAHVGIGILMIGVIVSNTYERSVNFTLMEGMGPKEAFGYQFNYERMTGQPIADRPLNPDYARDNAVQIRVTPPAAETPSDGSAKTFLMGPKWFATDLRVANEKEIKHTFWPAIQKYFGHDLYITLANDGEFRWPTDDPNKERAGIVLKEGERRKFGEYVVGYFEHFGDPGKTMGAHLVILTPDKKIIEAKPFIDMTTGSLVARNEAIPDIKDENGNPAVAILDSIDPSTKAATIRLSLPGYNGAWAVPLVITYKPWVNLVWLGVLIAVSGTLLAMVRRALEARRLTDEPAEPRIEPNTWEMPSAP